MMRNIFDQYSQPENKLTHSLVSSLAQDRELLREFLRWSLRKEFSSKGELSVIEQSLPGEIELNEEEAEKKGLPDACVFDDNGWILAIESKVASSLSINQLRRHHDTLVRRGYKNPNLLIITTDRYKGELPPYADSKTWKEIYEWGSEQFGRSQWSKLFTDYFQILEARMVQSEYLRGGTLTKFTGVPFDSDNPYSYTEAKRLLRLIIDEFKSNKVLIKDLGIDVTLPGRGAIKGVKSTVIWDFLQFKEAKMAKDFTQYPHLTFDISFKAVGLKLTLPHRLNTDTKRRIFGSPFEHFYFTGNSVLGQMDKAIKIDHTLKPIIKILQRHYLNQSHSGIEDALLSFDLRTIARRKKGQEKYQPEWVRTAYEAMRNKRSNMQMQIGVEIPLGKSEVIKTAASLKVLEESARALRPFLDMAFGRT